MTKLPIQLSFFFLAGLLIACQPDHRKAHESDQIYLFLQEEVAKMDKSIADLDKELAEMQKPSAEDEASLLTMKTAAYRASLALLKKQRSFLVQEKTYLEMKARTRAHNVISRSSRGEKVDGKAEFSSFTARWPAVSGTPGVRHPTAR